MENLSVIVAGSPWPIFQVTKVNFITREGDELRSPNFLCRYLSSRCRVAEGYTGHGPIFTSANGVPQGSALSPVLLTVYIGVLSSSLTARQKRCLFNNTCLNDFM